MERVLQELFAANFLAYYKTHAAHANIVGRNFVSDHKLLDDIYSDLQSQIDTIAELLRTIKGRMPSVLDDVIRNSAIRDEGVSGSAMDYIATVYDDIERLIEIHKDVESEAGFEYSHIANYTQDRVAKLNKFCWMLRSILDDE